MANEVYGRTWKVDNAAGGVLHTGPFRAAVVRWVSPTSVSDDECVIRDSLNNILWHSRATGANHIDESVVRVWWNQGFQVTALSSGTLYITVD